jgi:serine O-acetyltransferase
MKTIDPFIKDLYRKHQDINEYLPDINDTRNFIDDLISLLFPNNPCDNLDQFRVRFKESRLLLEKLMVSLSSRLEGRPEEQSELFFDALPDEYNLLTKDADAIYQFDPAVTNLQEVICAYPGFYSIAVYRIANLLYRQRVPLLPRIMSEYAHSKTGIDIHPGSNW